MTDDHDGHEPEHRPASRLDDGDTAGVEADLAARGEPYARVTVVRREPPVSANVGDRGVVTADGTLHGWIGGASCAQTIARTQATAAIEAGEPRLVGIAPDPDTVDRPGLEAFPMTCHSEGVLELFVEPVFPTPELVVVGGSPVARSLARLADELTLRTTLVDPDGGGENLPEGTQVVTDTDPDAVLEAVGAAPLVVVASMGAFDARGLVAGVRADAPYLGLVASDARAAEVTEVAADLLGVDAETVRERVTNPAGVDIDAHTPAELAASLLAEVVDERAAARRAGASGHASARAETDGETDTDTETDDAVIAGAETDTDTDEHTDTDTTTDTDTDGDAAGDAGLPATDPVCGMAVEDPDAPAVEHAGETFRFCCTGCADSFRADPESYLEPDTTADAAGAGGGS